jgi:hypothetical protein
MTADLIPAPIGDVHMGPLLYGAQSGVASSRA